MINRSISNRLFFEDFSSKTSFHFNLLFWRSRWGRPTKSPFLGSFFFLHFHLETQFCAFKDITHFIVFPAKNHKSLLINPSPSCFFYLRPLRWLGVQVQHTSIECASFRKWSIKNGIGLYFGSSFSGFVRKKIWERTVAESNESAIKCRVRHATLSVTVDEQAFYITSP